MTESQKTFILDQLIRSYECKNTIYTMQSANDLCDSIPLSQKQFLILLYREIEENIIKRVKISSPKGIHNIDQIWYHFKFGWVISCEAGRAYLGKIDLPQADIQIGIHSYFSSKADIRGTRKLFIGAFTSIANNVTILTSNISHPTQFASTYNLGGNLRIVDEGEYLTSSFYDKSEFKDDCIIGNDVWIGEDVCLMNSVKLGNGCVIGTRALVAKDCQPYGIYGGVPARLIQYRFSKEIIEQLQKIKWWDWSMDKIKKNEQLFLTDLLHYEKPLEKLIKN